MGIFFVPKAVLGEAAGWSCAVQDEKFRWEDGMSWLGFENEVEGTLVNRFSVIYLSISLRSIFEISDLMWRLKSLDC
jgi:hypothetical protein